jgi:hypothetical protein
VYSCCTCRAGGCTHAVPVGAVGCTHAVPVGNGGCTHAVPVGLVDVLMLYL